ncbi:MAG TPA: L,D-transpeptidase family protein [Hyphomicrobiaceae bacterium]|nr:L,D-transpeptidase family protein [Hyphomicrobiaceae bacterium]
MLGLSVMAVPSATAQHGQWWERSFPGANGRREGPRVAAHEERRERPQSQQLNDLRPGRTPWRSQEMIDAMEAAIGRYQNIVTKGGWPTIPGSQPIRPEDNDERVALLYRRLSISGEWKRPPQQSLFGVNYSDGMEEAVRRFQENNGLRVTGRVDRQTLQALNVPAIARLAQLRINLQRLRELTSQKVDDRYVLVNAAAFQLEAVERGQVELRHRVIVGKIERQTPTVHAMIKALNFFPYWRVPLSVATKDLIPRLQTQPEYLEQEKIRVLNGSYNGPEIDPTSIDWRQADTRRLRFRQDPGPQNALGFVRIDMQNPEGVYMHDTPMRHLFNQRWRAFSAGCVRVQDVFTLVEWLAKYEPGWSQPGRTAEVLAAGQALDVHLSKPVPVYFTYITAWAELDGRIIFRRDLYGRDGVRDLYASDDRDDNDGTPPQRFTLAP